MLKRAYVSVAQTMLAAPMSGCYASASLTGHQTAPGSLRRWFASLGAIYHLERMLALDIPWWNVAATRAVEAFLAARPGARVFEYGSGASTIWLARRSERVISVEHDADWARALGERVRDHSNVELICAPYALSGPAETQPYVRAIANTGAHDLIVIDGRLRAACLAAAMSALRPGGIILFDDSGRARYRGAIAHCGLAEEHFRGLSYCVPYPDHSSILRAA